MKRIAIIPLCLFCLSAVAYGQQVAGWVQLRDGRVVPVVMAERRQERSPRTSQDWRFRASQDLRFRDSLRGGRDYSGQLGNALGEYLREKMEQRRELQREDAVRRQHELPNYDAALRREWEANRRAAYEERVNPSSWQAERLRQTANQASMERARAEAAIRLRAQNDIRSLYGNGVSTVPTRQQWTRPSPVNNRASSWLQGRQVSDRERAAIAERDRASARASDAYRAYDKAVREGRDPREHIREFNKASTDFVTHAFETTEVGRDAAARNAAREKAANDSRQPRESNSASDKKSWQDRQREWADRKP